MCRLYLPFFAFLVVKGLSGGNICILYNAEEARYRNVLFTKERLCHFCQERKYREYEEKNMATSNW